jgi:hypothetical protein
MPSPGKDWKVAVAPGAAPLIVEVINAHTVFGWLSKNGRTALLSAECGPASGHPLTLRSLRGHGLLDDDNSLTLAGKSVVRWNKPKPDEPDSPAAPEPENGAPIQ